MPKMLQKTWNCTNFNTRDEIQVHYLTKNQNQMRINEEIYCQIKVENLKIQEITFNYRFFSP